MPFSRVAVALSLALVGCRHIEPLSAEQKAQEAVTVDGGVREWVPGECHPPPGAPGNALHVGQYCTPGGKECRQNLSGTATACAGDYDPTGRSCIKIFCDEHSECGENACCYGPPGALAKACVPVQCATDGGACPQ
ncbi:MAG: hypothetical protein ACKVPX_05090 [Myxococcaceae bacterium]